MQQPKLCTAELVAGGHLVVTILEGKIREAAVAYQLRDEIIAAVDDLKPSNMVLDLANVSFIGSVGFLAFLGARRHLGRGRIVLCNASDPVRDMFTVCRLISTGGNVAAPFEIVPSRAEALTLLSS